MARWFGSSGIRGPYRGAETPAFAHRLGVWVAQSCRRILVGHDVRTTGPLLASAFASGALAQGAAVTWAGPAATPSLAYGARGQDVALAVTASHNPPQDNGFKFWNPDGSAWEEKQERALESLLEEERLPARPSWKDLQPLRERRDVSQRHIEGILAFAGGFEGRVALDCGNGAGSYVSPALLHAAGAQVELLFGQPDGRFPNRPSEPSPENLRALSERCRARSTWGIAHDGDADRVAAVDPTGAVVPSDLVLVALALQRGARRLVVPIDASLALARALPEASFTLCRVGDATVSATLRAQEGHLGGETSGTYVVPSFGFAPDGPLAGLLFLQAMRDGLVEEARRRLRPTVRKAVRLPFGAVDRATFSSRLAQVEPGPRERASRVDGLRLEGEDGWTLIRPSGTEPLVRVSCEGLTGDAADAWLERGVSIAKGLLRAA